MKKLFTILVASLCGTMAYAQSSIVLSDVTLAPGGTQDMTVTIGNSDSYTAFQFDVKVPAGVSVKEAKLAKTSGEDRKLEKGLYNEETNTYRFLSYDMKNAKLEEGEQVILTLEAGDDTSEGGAETADVLYVDPEGTPSPVAPEDNAVAAVSVKDAVSIHIGSSGATTFVCSADLDFTGNADLSAFVVTGMEGNSLWLARVFKIPAGTPIVVKAANGEGDYDVNTTTWARIYYQNMLIGNNTDAGVTITPDGSNQYLFLSTSGFSKFTSARNIGAHKAYVRVAPLPAANAGSAWPLEIKTGFDRTSLCADVDLDFSEEEDLKVYTVMGYDNGSMLMTAVKHASAGTPLYIKGPEGTYNIKSAAVQTVYANMLVGNNSDAAINIQPTDGEYRNFTIGKSGFSKFSSEKSVGAHKSYLQVLLTYCEEPASTRGMEDFALGEIEVEMMSVNIGDDDLTGIKAMRQVSEQQDTWHNLNGQRIDTPTRKGLYIKNGKKVIVK
jgi:hypothetical protein